MKRLLIKWLLWSWMLTLPLIIIGTYITVRSAKQFYTYGIKYKTGVHDNITLNEILEHEIESLLNKGRASLYGQFGDKSQLKKIHLFVPKSNLSTLHSNMPHSGFYYVKGKIIHEGKLSNFKIKYRGDSTYRWAWDKKSIRIKTSKKALHEGIRAFNLLAPRSNEQLNNYLSYRLATSMGLLAPKTELVRVYMNGDDQGIHSFVEQIEEITLRRNRLMPGDIYKGENAGKDHVLGSHVRSLFKSDSIWVKNAGNNHYDLDSTKPLQYLIHLIQDQDSAESQAELSKLLDMDQWGKFSAFETLVQSRHTDELHNWLIYYDPWKQQFLPIVWDPMGWGGSFPYIRNIEDGVITSSFHTALFKNGDFLRARDKAFDDFFGSDLENEFYQFVQDTIQLAQKEIKTDPLLRPAKPNVVKASLDDLEEIIHIVFDETKKTLYTPDGIFSYSYENGNLRISIDSLRTIKRIKLNFKKQVQTPQHTIVQYQGLDKIHSVDISHSISNLGTALEINNSFSSNWNTTGFGKNPATNNYNKRAPGNYQINFSSIHSDMDIESVSVDDGLGWHTIKKAEQEIKLTNFTKQFFPVKEAPRPSTQIWSGTKIIEEFITITDPVIIEPGTQILLSADAGVIFENKVIAEGTAEKIIEFRSLNREQKPWGTVALQGQGASGSRFSNCLFENGSGIKTDLFEYTAMFSIHNSNDVEIHHSTFRDNSQVDDMVHAVYSEILFSNCSFTNALSDALDMDISKASVQNCRFENSGNDAIDLMSTRAVVIGSQILSSGDKGISVGEGSQLFASNNHIEGNLFGVQAKDGSMALLLNQTLSHNQTALDAYKKNWQYDDGGTIIACKSIIHKNQHTASADKHSKIAVFDSYTALDLASKRIQFMSSDLHEISTATSSSLHPEFTFLSEKNKKILQDFEAEISHYSQIEYRGAR